MHTIKSVMLMLHEKLRRPLGMRGHIQRPARIRAVSPARIEKCVGPKCRSGSKWNTMQRGIDLLPCGQKEVWTAPKLCLVSPYPCAAGEQQENGNCGSFRAASCASLIKIGNLRPARSQSDKRLSLQSGFHCDFSRQDRRPPLSGNAIALPPLRYGGRLGADVRCQSFPRAPEFDQVAERCYFRCHARAYRTIGP